MKKLYIALIATVFLMTFVIAGSYVFEITPVVIPATISSEKVVAEELITFNCDGEPMEVNGSEPDGQWDENDIKSALSSRSEEHTSELQSL